MNNNNNNNIYTLARVEIVHFVEFPINIYQEMDLS